MMSFQVDPHALYSLDELRDLLRGLVEMDTFLDRLGLRDRRIFRNCLTGQEILAALEAARRNENFFSRHEETMPTHATITRTPQQRRSTKRKLGVEDLRN